MPLRCVVVVVAVVVVAAAVVVAVRVGHAVDASCYDCDFACTFVTSLFLSPTKPLLLGLEN